MEPEKRLRVKPNTEEIERIVDQRLIYFFEGKHLEKALKDELVKTMGEVTVRLREHFKKEIKKLEDRLKDEFMDELKKL